LSRVRFALLAAAGVLTASSAGAVTCGLTLVGVVFGSYDTLSGQNVDSAGSVSVSCDAGDSYSIALSPGHGTMLARQMQGGTSLLYYNLYTDALRTIIWGDGTSGTATVSASGTGGLYTVYGRIPASQNVPAGTYTDTLTVTLTF
jgi:spore coat protein U-like protein